MLRVATENIVLTLDSGMKVAVRKGDQIGLYPQLLHLDPDIYDNPLVGKILLKFCDFLFDNF